MAENKSSRSGFRPQPRLTIAELQRIAEMAYRYTAWNDWDAPADRFADAVFESFEALLADHAQIAGYAIRCPDYGTQLGEAAAKIPAAWRPGWNWPGRS